MTIVQKTASDIIKLKIQGAKAVSRASLISLKKYSLQLKNQPTKKYLFLINQAIALLQQARPTEPGNHNRLNIIKSILAKNSRKSTVVLIKIINQKIDRLLMDQTAAVKKIVNCGKTLIKNGQNVFTHCHSSTVEDLLKAVKKTGKKFKVYNDETRPLFQGRITAKNLSRAGINTTMLADSAAAYTVSNKSGDKININLVLFGADAILKDGSIYNKIGSFGIALAAHDSNIPVYAVADLFKFDPTGQVAMELRSVNEIWKRKPQHLKIINFAFDKVPAKFITGLITEAGIIKPRDVKKFFNNKLKGTRY